MKQNAMKNLSMANKREAAFITDGFCNWKDALDSFGEHKRGGCLIIANTYENVVPKCNKVPKMLMQLPRLT